MPAPDEGRPEPAPPREPLATRVARYFVDEAPTFWVAMAPLFALSALLYTRDPRTNFIFDEQEALLANPYVNGKSLRFVDVVHRDFWGLPHDRSIGSYRPIPDVVWRLLADAHHLAWQASSWVMGRFGRAVEPFALNVWLFHWVCVILHAANGAILVGLVDRVTRRRDVAWLAGAIFVASAVLTEAVSGVVGIADVLGGLGALFALVALERGLVAMPFALAAAMLFGLFSKESAVVCVPLVPVAALCLAPAMHPGRPLRVLRALVALVVSVGALVVYVELRKRWFPSPLPKELTDALPEGAGRLARASRAFMVWFHQPVLPRDPLNNPLATADAPHRVAGALRVYARGLGQVVFPRTLSGDYSFPQEPVPDALVFPESVVGALGLVAPPLAALVAWIAALVAERRARAAGAVIPVLGSLVAVGLVWTVVSYFPHSNIPVVLPTVRAERFWYFPVIGTSMVLAVAFAALREKTSRIGDGAIGWGAFAFFFVFQCAQARRHALDYRDDLSFWDATRRAVPRSAKAHLNYSVMKGARGDLDARLASNQIAADLAPSWPMAHVYLGDTLCRMHRPDEAYPHYTRGFELAENDLSLIALGLQCLWDEGAFARKQDDLVEIADKYPGSWLSYLVHDLVENGEKHGGVDPQHRPRGYNEGPKE